MSGPRSLTYVQALNEALREEMRRDPAVMLMGEDIAVWGGGGVFGVTRGLLEEFGPDRVRDTPISEAGFTGVGLGAALAGLRPVVEYMYVDFSMLAMDQICNQAAKIRWMLGGGVDVPLVIRAQQGAGRGNGPQHSQSLEAWFTHTPGLTVALPSTPYDAKGLLKTAIRSNDPVVFLEHKLLYGVSGPVPESDYTVPFGQAAVLREGRDVTCVGVSIMNQKALEAAEILAADGIEMEVIDPRTLVPYDRQTVARSIVKTGRLVVTHQAPGAGRSRGRDSRLRSGRRLRLLRCAPCQGLRQERAHPVQPGARSRRHPPDRRHRRGGPPSGAGTAPVRRWEAVIIEVAMPVLGLTMEQGTIVAWLKEEGDEVAAGEPLFMVETDKATSDAPSPAGGILARILCEEGETVAVGRVIAYLAETADDLGRVPAGPAGAAGLQPEGAQPQTARCAPATPAGAPATMGGEAAPVPGRVLASPRARARARSLGIDLAAAPAGVDRLTEKDVLAMSEKPSRPQVQPLSRTRRIIAERMTLSATTIPQVTYTLRCDITDALALRRGLKTNSGGERATVSLDALLVRAAALALAGFPQVNSQWAEGEGIRLLPQVNIAVAVDLEERGLVIPVVHDADRLDIRATAAELDRLVAGARAGKLGPDDYAGGTFTITSLAPLGVESFNPIIVPPQAAILGVGAIIPTPVFQRDQVVKRRMLALSLTTDHRILDGAPSARFLSKIRDLLEQPARLAE